MADVTFLGACGTVTGSSTLLSFGKTRILVDCGFYQGDDALEERNYLPFPFSPADLSAVLLTHAHLDHCGLLPRLTAAGFDGPIHCTKSGRGLTSIVLEDAGEIQEESARYARRKGYSRRAEPRPLYTADDARRAIRLLAPAPFDELREIAPGIRFRFRRAGHLLGAASIEVQAKGGDGERRSWCFSGDVGRYGAPILKDPAPPLEPPAALLLESTYGDRDHPRGDPEAELEAVIRRVFGRGGLVMIPAFALGRTQEVLYHLSVLADRGVIDPQNVFLDSPMAIDATGVYERARAEHDEEMARLASEHLSPLAADRFQRTRSVEQSKQLNRRREPAVIVAGSGMATGGRIVHHFLQHLGDPKNAVVFVGYQAAGTRGRAMVEGAATVGIHGVRVEVRAEVLYLETLSAHADQGELVRWCEALPGRPGRIFLNHGEDPPRKALSALLAERGYSRPQLPATGETVPW